MFYEAKKAEIKALMDGCGYCANVTTYPLSVSYPVAIPDPEGVHGDCRNFPGSADEPNQGEPYKPKERT
jgi:gamma-glutamylcyclotransferase (GGCT)/AIG2-like uncharacterized protein YtfP